MECAEIENNKKVQNGDRNSKTNNSSGSFIHRRDEITQRVQIKEFSNFLFSSIMKVKRMQTLFSKCIS